MKESKFLQPVQKAFKEAFDNREWFEVRIDCDLEIVISAKEYPLKAKLESAIRDIIEGNITKEDILNGVTKKLPVNFSFSDMYVLRDYFAETGESEVDVLYHCASTETDNPRDREELLILHNFCTFGK